jgi:hypothetical protein
LKSTRKRILLKLKPRRSCNGLVQLTYQVLEQERKGKLTLKKWCCPECGLNVRMGIAEDPKLRHHTCESELGRQVFLVPGDMYIAKK